MSYVYFPTNDGKGKFIVVDCKEELYILAGTDCNHYELFQRYKTFAQALGVEEMSCLGGGLYRVEMRIARLDEDDNVSEDGEYEGRVRVIVISGGSGNYGKEKDRAKTVELIRVITGNRSTHTFQLVAEE